MTSNPWKITTSSETLNLSPLTTQVSKVSCLISCPSMKASVPVCKAWASTIAPSTPVSRICHIQIRRNSGLLRADNNHTASTTRLLSSHNIASTRTYTMSQKPFSNTEVPADKPADPYKATNKSEPELKEKVQDLVSFIESCKFGMMTTRIGSSGLLTSRCMALAAKVIHNLPNITPSTLES